MLDNPIGTAPGFEVKIGRCTFFCLPGVPREMKRMLEQIVLPRAMVLLGNQRIAQQSAAYSVYGLTEAVVGERLDKLAANYPAVRIGLRAAFPVIHVKLNVQETDGPSAAELLAQADQWIRKTLGRKLFATGNASMAEVVGRLLTRKASTLALAESCTGGLIANWVTDVAGSSDYFLFSGVTYANSSKIGVLKVSPNLISQVGAVHEDTAQAMAQGARLIAGATYGLATSGIAGPSGGTPDKPVGTVCIGLATPHKTAGYRYTFPYRNRLKNKEVFAMQALDLLRRELLQTKLE
jgi:nicotinamide-nucleotide amidase